MKEEFVMKFLEEMRTKKISINLDESTLNLIDDLVKITKKTRTDIIGVLISYGVKGFVEYLENAWMNMKKNKKNDILRIDHKLSELKKFKEKYEVDKFP